MSPSRRRDEDHDRLRAALLRGDPVASEAPLTSEDLLRMRRAMLAAVRTEPGPAWGRLALAGAVAALLGVAAIWWEAPRPPVAGRAPAARAAGTMAAPTPISPNSPNVLEAQGTVSRAGATPASPLPLGAVALPRGRGRRGVPARARARSLAPPAPLTPLGIAAGGPGAELGPDPGGQVWARAESPAPPDESEVPVCEEPQDCQGHQIEFSTSSGLRVIWVLPRSGLRP